MTVLCRQADFGARPAVAYHFPGVGGGIGLMHDQCTRGTLPGRFGVLVIPAPVVGHGIAVEQCGILRGKAGVVNQHHHGFTGHVHARIVVPAALGRVDSIAHKHQLGIGDTGGCHLLLGRHHHLLAVGPISIEGITAYGQHGCGVSGHRGDGHFL